MEILIVLAIIGTILLIAIPRITKTRQIGNEVACQAEISSIIASLELYYTKYHAYPDTLELLIKGGFIADTARTDPWGNPYIYRPAYVGKKNTSYELFSTGEDAIAGTEDDVASEKGN